MRFIIFFSVVCLASVASCEEVATNCTLLYNATEGCSAREWVVNVTGGIGLVIDVWTLNVTSDDDAYFAISTEKEMNGTSASVAYISGSVADLHLVIPLTTTAYIVYENGASNCTDLFYNITLSTYVPLPEYVPPEIPDPEPPAGIVTDIQVNFAGKDLDTFNSYSLQDKLKAAVRKYANEFCDPPYSIVCNAAKPDNETVWFNHAKTCPASWPDYETCVSVWMAVYLTPGRYEYQLQPKLLMKLWDNIEKGGFSASVGVQPYNFPPVANEVLWWALWVFIAVVATLVIALILWKMERSSVEYTARLAEFEEQRRKEEIFSGVEMRKKTLQPAKFQKIPDFMTGKGEAASITATPPPTKKHLFAKAKETLTLKLTGNSSSPENSPISPAQKSSPFFYRNEAYSDNEGDQNTN